MVHDAVRRFGVLETEGLVIEALAGELVEVGGERRRLVAFEARGDRPVLLRHERLDLALALADDAHRDRLHAAGGEPAAHLLPQERADLVADQPVEDAARLLRVVLVPIELERVLDRLLNGLLGDLVEQDAVDVLLVADALGDVPGDGLAFAIGVGRQVDVLFVFRGLLELVDDFALAVNDLVLRLEVVLDVDAELATSAGRRRDRPTPSRCSCDRGTSPASWPWPATQR